MSDVKNHINRITARAQQMLKEMASLKAENQTLQKTVADLNIRQKQQVAVIDELKQQVSVLKLAAGQMKDADKRELEKKINGYLKQLDKAIHALSE